MYEPAITGRDCLVIVFRLIGYLREPERGVVVVGHRLAFRLCNDAAPSHLRRMHTVYGTKHATLLDGIAPLKHLGWSWPTNPAGMHLLVRHERGDYVRRVAAASRLELALLSSYRFPRKRQDGLLLRFGALEIPSLIAGATALVAAARTMA